MRIHEFSHSLLFNKKASNPLSYLSNNSYVSYYFWGHLEPVTSCKTSVLYELEVY